MKEHTDSTSYYVYNTTLVVIPPSILQLHVAASSAKYEVAMC